MPTESSTAASPPSLDLSGEPERTQYRPISPWSVATLLVGLASPLALIGPLLWFVPLIAIPFGWLAFRQLAQRELRYIGQTAAVSGLCLAALFCGWSVAQRLSREARISAEAQKFADAWLDIVLAGKLHEAHQLQSAASRRQSHGTDLSSYYEAQSDAGKDFETFRSTEPLKSLAGRQDDIKLVCTEVRHIVDGLTDHFTLRYEITTGEIAGSSGAIWVSCQREHRPDTAGADWQMTGIALHEPQPLQ